MSNEKRHFASITKENIPHLEKAIELTESKITFDSTSTNDKKDLVPLFTTEPIWKSFASLWEKFLEIKWKQVGLSL